VLRLACCLCTERGIAVCAPVHDALLVEAPADEIDDIVAQTQAAMSEASCIVLDGFFLPSEAKVVRWPQRYRDERGGAMWDRVMELLPGLRTVEMQGGIPEMVPCTERISIVSSPRPGAGAWMIGTSVRGTSCRRRNPPSNLIL
jgi:hypothetical protein